MGEAERLVEEAAMGVCAANRKGFACVCRRDGRSPITCGAEACKDAIAGARVALAIGLEAAAKIADDMDYSPDGAIGRALRALLP